MFQKNISEDLEPFWGFMKAYISKILDFGDIRNFGGGL